MKDTTSEYARLGAAVVLSILGVITLMMIPEAADPSFGVKLIGSKAAAVAGFWGAYALTHTTTDNQIDHISK